MIRSAAAADKDTVRRLVGLLLVVALVLVLFAGFAHAADADHGPADAHDCGLCLALFQIAVALPVLTAWLLGGRTRAAAVAPAPARAARAGRDARPPPARGPPATL